MERGPHARAHADAMDEALRESVDRYRLLKTDIALLKTDLEHRIDLAVRDMTIRSGMMAVAIVAVLTSLKLFG